MGAELMKTHVMFDSQENIGFLTFVTEIPINLRPWIMRIDEIGRTSEKYIPAGKHPSMPLLSGASLQNILLLAPILTGPETD